MPLQALEALVALLTFVIALLALFLHVPSKLSQRLALKFKATVTYCKARLSVAQLSP